MKIANHAYLKMDAIIVIIAPMNILNLIKTKQLPTKIKIYID